MDPNAPTTPPAGDQPAGGDTGGMPTPSEPTMPPAEPPTAPTPEETPAAPPGGDTMPPAGGDMPAGQ